MQRMIGYDYRINQDGTPATPLAGFRGGLWWAWAHYWLGHDVMPAVVREYLRHTINNTDNWTDDLQPLMDMEGMGRIVEGDENSRYDFKKREKIVREVLSWFKYWSNSKVLLIEFFPGIVEGLSMQNIEMALNTTKTSSFRTRLFAQARAHRDIVQMCGTVMSNCVIHTPQQLDWFLNKWFTAMIHFRREAYPSTEHCAWLCGAYTAGPHYGQELTIEESNKVADKIFADGFAGFCLYGSIHHNINLGNVLSQRLIEHNNKVVAAQRLER